MSATSTKDLVAEAKAAEKDGRRTLASARYAQAAMRQRRSGRLKEARSLLERSLRLTPESPRLYVQLVLLAMDERNDAAATEAMETFSRYALQKHQRLAEYRAYLEKELQAFPALRQIFYDATLQLDRTAAAPFLARAKARLEQKDTEGALKTVLDALKTRSQEAEVRALLKQILVERGDREGLKYFLCYEEAAMSRQDLVSLLWPRRDPPAEEARPAQSSDEAEEKTLSRLIADLEEELGFEGADEQKEIDPLFHEFRRRAEPVLAADARTRIDLALAYHGMGLHDAAMEELRKIPEDHAFFPEALVLLGQVLLSQESHLAALDVYQRCLREERSTSDIRAEARYQLVRLYLRLGDVRQAATFAKELHRERPTYRDLPTLRLELNEQLGSATKEHELRRAKFGKGG